MVQLAEEARDIPLAVAHREARAPHDVLGHAEPGGDFQAGRFPRHQYRNGAGCGKIKAIPARLWTPPTRKPWRWQCPSFSLSSPWNSPWTASSGPVTITWRMPSTASVAAW